MDGRFNGLSAYSLSCPSVFWYRHKKTHGHPYTRLSLHGYLRYVAFSPFEFLLLIFDFETMPIYKTFETTHRVRPDDIDMYNHVHNSKYFDYVLAARYDQMETCYGMGMDKFIERGFGWLVRTVYMDYKRPLKMNDHFIARTSIDSIDEKKCRVNFAIIGKATNKVCCDGWFDFVLIELDGGKAVLIPQDVIAHYTSFTN
jgi:YbgC/YbaW family acyl-CoA thioester hydrolase